MLIKLLDSELDDVPIAFRPPDWVAIVAVVAISLTAALALLVYLGIWLATLFTLAAGAAFMLWIRIGYRRPLSRRVLPAHILLIVANLIQGAEQLTASYASVVRDAFPHWVPAANSLTDAGIAITFTLSASILWLVGASQAFYHVRIGGFVILLLVTWSLIFPASHFLLPQISATAPDRVPGMASGLLVAALALLTLRFVFVNYPHQGVSHET